MRRSPNKRAISAHVQNNQYRKRRLADIYNHQMSKTFEGLSNDVSQNARHSQIVILPGRVERATRTLRTWQGNAILHPPGPIHQVTASLQAYFQIIESSLRYHVAQKTRITEMMWTERKSKKSNRQLFLERGCSINVRRTSN